MRKKHLRILSIIPLLIINLFNGLFIIYKAKGTKYIREIPQILGDYFIGFPLIPLTFIIFVLLLLDLKKKISLSSFLYKTFIVFLLSFTALNFSLFPEITKGFAGQEKFEFTKKDSSLKEAIRLSPARRAKVIQSYIEMNEYLKNRTLIIPFFSPTEKDYFFRVFITPKKIIKKEYGFRMDDAAYESLSDYPQENFIIYGRKKIEKQFILIDPLSSSDTFILFNYHNNFLFLSHDLAGRYILSFHD